MSGIFGILRLDGSEAGREELEGMMERIRHRGPDGSAIWNEGPAGIGHLMLHATPESSFEKMPLLNGSGDLVITADCRIDNRDELLAALSLDGESCSKIGDGGLILRSYERWGEDCLHRLLGDFAFAVVDLSRETLFCARDHMGVKPFYYFINDRAFVFASEIKAILSFPEVPRRLNEEMVSDFLVPILDDRQITFYQGVRRLPAACHLTLKEGKARTERYWSLDPKREIRLSSDEEYAAEFRRLFLEAVGCRLRCSSPVGVSLSGGLDSSSVASAARKISMDSDGGKILTFSAVFDDLPDCDEREFIGAVIGQGGFESTTIRADLLSPLGEFGDYLLHEDEPFWIPNYFMSWHLFKAARDGGARVIMDGFEGDVVVSHGLTHLSELFLAGRLLELFRNLRGLSKNFATPASRILWSQCIAPLAPEPAAKLYRWLRGLDGCQERCSIINPGFAERTRIRERIQSHLRGSRSSRDLRIDHHGALDDAYLQHVLEVIDRQAAAFSLEPRHPFLDRRLVEFCLALPSEQKLRRGWSRWVLRTAMAGILPDEIRWRGGKTILSQNFNRGLLAQDRKILEAAIFDDTAAIEDYVDVPLLQRTYRRFVAEGSNRDAITLWKTVILSLWLSAAGFAEESSKDRS